MTKRFHRTYAAGKAARPMAAQRLFSHGATGGEKSAAHGLCPSKGRPVRGPSLLAGIGRPPPA